MGVYFASENWAIFTYLSYLSRLGEYQCCGAGAGIRAFLEGTGAGADKGNLWEPEPESVKEIYGSQSR